MIKLQWPSDGWDQTQVRFILGIWRFFLLINLWKAKPHTDIFTEPPEYGISFHDDVLWIPYGKRSFTINMPWQWEIVRHDLLLPDGSVYWRNVYRDGPRQRQNHYSWYEILDGDRSPYKSEQDSCLNQVRCADYIDLNHHTKSGMFQPARIRLCGEEREWRWRWFKWLPFPRKIQRTVDCWSDAELGDRAGSWKGGMLGWSVEWEKDESMKSAFYRWYKKWDGN